ncbi:MAG: GGDEF domain-containing protein, partial [bacterium]
MTAYGFLWAADLSLLLALIGVGGLARARGGWKPFPVFLIACLLWVLDIGLLRYLQQGLVPVGTPHHMAGVAAAAQGLLLWVAAVESGQDERGPMRALLTVYLAAVSAVFFVGTIEQPYFRVPEWVFPAAGCLPPAAALALWAAGKTAPRHFLTQSFVFLLLAAALEFLPRMDPVPGGFLYQLHLLALGFAFFSLILHVAQGGRSREEERISRELPRLLAGYLSTLRSLLKSKSEAAPPPDTDPVTRLQNFSSFHRSLNEAMKEADMQSHRFALVFIDIEDLSRINRQAGFDTGDRFLRGLGEGILKRVDPAHAGRIGGDEFALIIFGEQDAVLERTGKILGELRRELDGIYEGVGMKAAYSLYPFDFFEQSGVFRRMRAAVDEIGAGPEPVRV